jgi:beta-lactamase superfamily II metal-dependent hydrolase
MKVEIFDVGAGACALLTGDNGERLMIDCGSNADGWRPGTYLTERGIHRIEMLAITNYDEDHLRGLPNLLDSGVQIGCIVRNPSVDWPTIQTLKSDTGVGPGIKRLFYELQNTFTSSMQPSEYPTFGGLVWTKFWNNHPFFDDENNLSMALFLEWQGVGIMFPGDLEIPGFEALVQRQDFCAALARTNVYVASHHGRESGCSPAAFSHMRSVECVVVSDKGYMYDTQETWQTYRNLCTGGGVYFRDEIARRFVLTTRNDGKITIEKPAFAGWKFY